jgi:hypothetical protein
MEILLLSVGMAISMDTPFLVSEFGIGNVKTNGWSKGNHKAADESSGIIARHVAFMGVRLDASARKPRTMVSTNTIWQTA